jgi:hypothetical protein
MWRNDDENVKFCSHFKTVDFVPNTNALADSKKKWEPDVLIVYKNYGNVAYCFTQTRSG